MPTLSQPTRYPFDPTGISPDNLVANETQTLPSRRIRAIIPQYGPFYANSSFKLVESATGRQLTLNTDYEFGELVQIATQKTGIGVYSVVLVTNPNVQSNVILTYQSVGGEYSYSPQVLLALISQVMNEQPNTTINWADVIGKPDAYLPVKHLHDVGDVFGFEYVVQALERIRNAMLWSDAPMYDSLLNWIADQMSVIDQRFTNLLNAQLGFATQSLLSQMNKSNIGLGSVANYAPASYNDGQTAGAPTALAANVSVEKYMTLSAAIGLKDQMLAYLVRGDKTGIGQASPNVVGLTRVNLASLNTLSCVYVQSQVYCQANQILFEKQAFPTNSTANSTYVVLKLSNLPGTTNNGGGYYLFLDTVSYAAYFAYTPDSQTWPVYVPLPIMSDMQTLTVGIQTLITDHIKNGYNPHNVTSDQVGLGLVPNYAAADSTDIALRRNVKKFVTLDMLNAYATKWLQPVSSSSSTTNTDGSTSVNYKPSVTVKDQAGTIIGYMFSPTDTRDPAATVLITDGNGTSLGYVYPSQTDYAAQEFADQTGSPIGFVSTTATYTVTTAAANTVNATCDVVVDQPTIASGTSVAITMYFNGLTPGATYKATPTLTSPTNTIGNYQLNGKDVVLTVTATTTGSGVVQFTFPTAGIAIGRWVIGATITTDNENDILSTAGGLLVIT
jgi:hypothetical protein